MPNAETRMISWLRHSDFVIDSDFWFRSSGFFSRPISRRAPHYFPRLKRHRLRISVLQLPALLEPSRVLLILFDQFEAIPAAAFGANVLIGQAGQGVTAVNAKGLSAGAGGLADGLNDSADCDCTQPEPKLAAIPEEIEEPVA